MSDWTVPWGGEVFVPWGGDVFHPTGGWQVAARPNAVRVTFTLTDASEWLFQVGDGGYNVIGDLLWGVTLYPPGTHTVDIPITWGEEDIYSLTVGDSITIVDVALVGFTPFWTGYKLCREY